MPSIPQISVRYFRLLNLIVFLGCFFIEGFSQHAMEKVIDARPVPDSIVVIDSVFLKGNKVTKDKIVTRELLFWSGDTLPGVVLQDVMERSRENLLNTALFNFVTIDALPSSKPAHINVEVSMIERWYIWPFPIFELSDRNFNAWLESGDLSRVSYGAFVTWENFRGRKETLKFRLRFGYNEQYDLYYKIPYINKKKTLGIGMGTGVSFNHETSYKTENNKLLYYKDEDSYVKKETFGYLQLLYRKGIYNTQKFEISYSQHEFDDTLLLLNPGFSLAGVGLVRFFSLYYEFRSDHRDFKAYPLTGYYFDAGIEKIGLGIFGDSPVDILQFMSTFRKYWQLDKRWYFAFGLNGKFSNKYRQPYFLTRGLGYGRNFVRSYEYYVIDGQNFGLLKTNLKFAILPTRVFNIGFISSEKFNKVHVAVYANLFADLGFADNPYPNPASNNFLQNSLLAGYGLGLDFVTYYDVVFRTEFSVNRMGEYGFFLHFMAPI